MEQEENCIFRSIFLCFSLSITYLASLHIWNSPYSRDHPSTIKKRFISAFLMLFISPCFLYVGLSKEILEKASLWELLGLRLEGVFNAIVLPVILTMVLFLGPLCTEFFNKNDCKVLDSKKWYYHFSNLIWLRNHVVAPLSEEFTYRSCMMPLLLQCFTPKTAIIINPLFFGLAHFHHIWERIHHMNMSFAVALQISFFQFAFTTIFGIYSSYLFYKTRHFLSIFMVHAYCNHMGFPEINELINMDKNRKFIIILLYLIGFITWWSLLEYLTQPDLYGKRSLFGNKL